MARAYERWRKAQEVADFERRWNDPCQCADAWQAEADRRWQVFVAACSAAQAVWSEAA